MLEFITWTVGMIIAVVIGVDFVVMLTEALAAKLRRRRASMTECGSSQQKARHHWSGRQDTDAAMSAPSILPLHPKSDSYSQARLESERHKARAA